MKPYSQLPAATTSTKRERTYRPRIGRRRARQSYLRPPMARSGNKEVFHG
ncbi:hypothetical protein [Herbaspirillum sp. ST 5-3]|nr:hypothetical protein [Herbaspirillum sp. ST 5-3]